MNERHEQIVKILQTQIRDYYKAKKPYRVFHGSTNSTRVITFKRNEMVDISIMNRVLSIDTKKRVAIAEPNVPMDKLVKETLKYGLIPPVVTEFPGITVGGAIQGSAGESGSFQWGCFSQTVDSMEMILGNGERVDVSATLHPDLFYGTAGSYGSLGLVTAAKIKLIPTRKYVHVRHIPVTSFNEAVEVLEKCTKSSCDFIECLMFSKNIGNVIVGNLSDNIVGKVCRFSRPYDPWYYLYAKHIAETGKEVTNTFPLKDYLFRYNRGAFWAGKLAFEYFDTPFNAFTRFIFDPLMRTRKLYQALQDSAAGQRVICQDIVLPAAKVVPFMDYIDKKFVMYPMVICPIKPEARSPLQSNGFDINMVYNVGVYGLRVEPYQKFIEANRQIESRTHELGGKKWFYAHSYYSEKEFWQIYNKKWYDELRQKYHATYLPDIYSRIRVNEKPQEIDTKRTVIKTILGRAKLRIVD